MVRLYESTYTYLPFLYLYLISTAIGSVYHANDTQLVLYRPYTVLLFLLINTMVYRYYKSKVIIRSLIHKLSWKCVTYAVYGILLNLVHEMVFHDHHFDRFHYNMGWSALYLILTLVFGYYAKSQEALTFLHLAFLFIPIKRVWQVNLHVFTLLISSSIYMMYSKIEKNTLGDTLLHRMPLIRYFPYLRVQDEFIWVGFVQLYIEYYQRYIPDMEVAKDIEELTTMNIESSEEYGMDDE